MDKLFHDPRFMEAISSLFVGIVSLLGYKITHKINELKLQNEKNHKERVDSLNGIKRSSLRNEYMNFYNSKEFKWHDKYEKTRDIIEEYKSLGGNHYISSLDEIMLKKAIQEDENVLKGD
mgnify:FL=1